jgi:hypothetical protein
MNKKKLIVFGVIIVLIVAGLIINNKVDAKNAKNKEKKKDTDTLCLYPMPGPLCDWVGGEPYPKCGATYVCDFLQP